MTIEPAGPSTSAAQQTLQWMSRPYAYLRECHDQFGDTFTLDLGPQGRWVLFSHPDAIRTICTGRPRLLHAGKRHVGSRSFWGPGSLLHLGGQRHLRELKPPPPPCQGERGLEYSRLI